MVTLIGIGFVWPIVPLAGALAAELLADRDQAIALAVASVLLFLMKLVFAS